MNVLLVWVYHSVMQTEDELTRNMLASTASAINCTGGVNGIVIIAVKKSLVIDLEPEVAKLTGNKGQAG